MSQSKDGSSILNLQPVLMQPQMNMFHQNVTAWTPSINVQNGHPNLALQNQSRSLDPISAVPQNVINHGGFAQFDTHSMPAAGPVLSNTPKSSLLVGRN